MFFKYACPDSFYQRLHNQLGTAIFKFGQLLGVFSINIGLNGKTATRGSKALIIWSNFVSLFLAFGYLSYLIYYLAFLKSEEAYFSLINFILALMQSVVFGTFILVFGLIVILGRKKILKLVIFAKRLKYLFSSLGIDKNRNCQKTLVYANCVNIVVDLFLLSLIAILMIINFISEPILIEFMAVIFETTSWATDAFVSILYSISFSFVFYLLRKLSDNLRSEDCHHLSIYHYLLVKFLRKLNFFIQNMVVFLVFEAFLGLVSDVSSDLI